MNHKLLVAVDGGPTSGHTVTYVGRACGNGRQAPAPQVVLFHVLPPLPPYVEAGHSADAAHTRERLMADAEEAGRDLLERMKDQLVEAGARPEAVEIKLDADEGDVAGQIEEAARENDCDTIVIGRRGQSMVGQFFAGSVAEHLLRKPIGRTVWVVE